MLRICCRLQYVYKNVKIYDPKLVEDYIGMYFARLLFKIIYFAIISKYFGKLYQFDDFHGFS